MGFGSIYFLIHSFIHSADFSRGVLCLGSCARELGPYIVCALHAWQVHGGQVEGTSRSAAGGRSGRQGSLPVLQEVACMAGARLHLSPSPISCSSPLEKPRFPQGLRWKCSKWCGLKAIGPSGQSVLPRACAEGREWQVQPQELWKA